MYSFIDRNKTHCTSYYYYWREEYYIYNYKASIPGLHLAEERAKRFEHVALTIDANACDHEGYYK